MNATTTREPITVSRIADALTNRYITHMTNSEARGVAVVLDAVTNLNRITPGVMARFQANITTWRKTQTI